MPYGNHLEALKDDRKGQHSIRINDQGRICFCWQGQDAFDVEIVDYHWELESGTNSSNPTDFDTLNYRFPCGL